MSRAAELLDRPKTAPGIDQLVSEGDGHLTVEALLRTLHDHPARELRRFVTTELGSRWEPGSREELAGLLDLLRAAGP